MKTFVTILCFLILCGCATGPSKHDQARQWLQQKYDSGELSAESYLIGQDMVAAREAQEQSAQMAAGALLMQQGNAMRYPQQQPYNSGVIMTPGQPFTYWWGK